MAPPQGDNEHRAKISVGSTQSGLTRTTTVLIEKVGTRLTIMQATNTRTIAFRTQARGQPAGKAELDQQR